MANKSNRLLLNIEGQFWRLAHPRVLGNGVLLARLLSVPEEPNVYRTRIGKIIKAPEERNISLCRSTLRSFGACSIYLLREL